MPFTGNLAYASTGLVRIFAARQAQTSQLLMEKSVLFHTIHATEDTLSPHLDDGLTTSDSTLSRTEHGRVADEQRTQFFRDYLSQVLRAKKE